MGYTSARLTGLEKEIGDAVKLEVALITVVQPDNSSFISNLRHPSVGRYGHTSAHKHKCKEVLYLEYSKELI